MYCPECGGEFRPEISECPDCRVPLVEGAPPSPEPAWELELVTVFTAADSAAVVVAESLLAEAGVPFQKTGDGLQDLFGAGRLGTGFNILVGPVLFRVPKDRAEEAHEALEPLAAEPPGDQDRIEGE